MPVSDQGRRPSHFSTDASPKAAPSRRGAHFKTPDQPAATVEPPRPAAPSPEAQERARAINARLGNAEVVPGILRPQETGSIVVPEGAAFRDPIADPSRRGSIIEAPVQKAVDISGDTASFEAVDGSTTSLDAPRPIGIDPESSAVFERIQVPQAPVTAPSNDEEEFDPSAAARTRAAHQRIESRRRPQQAGRQGTPPLKRGPMVALGVLGVAMVVVVGLLIFGALAGGGGSTLTSTRIQEAQAAVGDTIEYDGYLYHIQAQDDGSYAFVRTAPDGVDPLTLFTLSGTPVTTVMHDGAFIIPENLGNDQWDVIAWVMGDGSIPTQLMSSTGEAVAGEGQITSAVLENDSLMLSFADDTFRAVPLS